MQPCVCGHEVMTGILFFFASTWMTFFCWLVAILDDLKKIKNKNI
jgi:hypothetical protein